MFHPQIKTNIDALKHHRGMGDGSLPSYDHVLLRIKLLLEMLHTIIIKVVSITSFINTTQ
jgi:hypothetical protein